MARKTSSSTTTSRTTTGVESKGAEVAARTSAQRKASRRVTSLEPRAGKALSSLEEAVVRMHHGVSVKPQAQLPTNGTSDELMSQLVDMEVRAHELSGRIDELPDVPTGKRLGARSVNARTARVVDELKKK